MLIVMFVLVGTLVLGCLGQYLDSHGVIDDYVANGRAGPAGKFLKKRPLPGAPRHRWLALEWGGGPRSKSARSIMFNVLG